ncbi:Structural maintenance of chromosome complex subunit SmcA [Penicillium argentinense]|uniref:Structural maintenance of chromosomes protein 5 n=1 Tax=Penicillium argentinense TaxID=1131581 RepID=A0A9W9G107_9EURO|nr:Structural maintenance of chromosome complex subunit SmcA [Penicillium argentinense]KAJ5110093.1 Structural maintenance of chromosome complex subunit SmcA [Penicillium argentinense]
MSSRSVPHRRHRSEDSEVDESDSLQPTSASNSKRQRLSPALEDSDESDENEDTEGADGSTKALPQPPRMDHRIGPGGYKAGAIVRIKVTDFVTYTSAEFFPGPKLNMVIGPNGTGKSTLVCAICLGLGGGPQHLGRAKDPGEFVKHGCAQAQIEIELAGQPKLSHNPIIGRTIKRDGNKNIFTLNGRPSSQKEIRKLAMNFAIQVDNLCQFLPQDKVAEFAALTPVELLHSTQRAAAGPEMVKWHQGLKDLRAEQKRVEIENRADREVLTNLESRQEMQREDVERMRQRDIIKRKMENFEFVRPIVDYKEYHQAFNELKARKIAAEQAYERLKQESEPSLATLNAKQEYAEEITMGKQYRKEQVEELSRKATAKKAEIAELTSSIKELDGKIDADKKSNTANRKEAQKVQQGIKQMERQRDEERVEFDPDFYNEKLNEKRLERRANQDRAAELKSESRPLNEKKVQLDSQINNVQRELERLNSAAGKQEAKLQSLSRDTLKAYRWILENQSKFKDEVFGPPIVTCSVTDPKYANAIESLVQRGDLLAITVQNKEDFRTLQRHLNVQLKLSDITIRTCSVPLSRAGQSPNIDIKSLGFDGWAKEFLSGPDPVLAMLCMDRNLGQAAIGLNDISEAAFTAAEEKLNLFVCKGSAYSIKRRPEYGPDAKSTGVRQLKNAQAWTTEPADGSIKARYTEDIRKLTGERSEVEYGIQQGREQLAEYQRIDQRIKRETEQIEAEKAEKQSAHTIWRALPGRISQQKQKLKSMTDLYDSVREQVRLKRIEQDQLAMQKGEATIQYSVIVEQLYESYEEFMKAELLHLEATSDIRMLQARCRDQTTMLELKRQELQKLSEEFRNSRQTGKQKLDKARRVTTEANQREGGEEVLGIINTEGYNMDSLNADIDSEKARLELSHGGSPNMIKEFENRERQIGSLKEKLAGVDKKLNDLNEALEEIRERWEPRLDALIAKISDAFSDSFARIGCAGQVGLDKVKSESLTSGEPGENEYDQWSIQIQVKFRQSEELSILNAHRQSGGERAVSTIFYLMALQSLSASPFRVVDEINQGMDPRNERMVHGRLVEIACASDEREADNHGNAIGGGGGGGQYFLITPKLLTELSYKPGMRVLCIYSGEHMPQDYQALDFSLAIRNMKSIAAQNGRSIGKGKGKARAIANHHQVDVHA